MNMDSDSLIVLRQSGQFMKINRPNGEPRSIAERAEELLSALGMKFAPTAKNFLLEITGCSNDAGIPYDSADEVEAAEGALLYGLISGDEGYAFVPPAVVAERLEHSWGSRGFIRLYAFGEACAFLNLLHGRMHSEYLERQSGFGGAAYGGMNDYFKMGSCPLTVNHGILFSVEFVMALKTLILGVVAYQSGFDRDAKQPFYQRIRETREYRRLMILALQKAENVEISEIGELGQVLLENQKIDPLVEKVKYMLELLESDLDLMYSERNDALMNFLTILGLVFAAVQVLQPFFMD